MRQISRVVSALALVLAASAIFAASNGAIHTSAMFQGPKANTGTVSHFYENGKSILRRFPVGGRMTSMKRASTSITVGCCNWSHCGRRDSLRRVKLLDAAVLTEDFRQVLPAEQVGPLQ